MIKVTYENTMPYEYNLFRRGAHYCLPSGSYRNHGEMCEHIAKFWRGIFTDVNPSTTYDTGSDIETERASVKSSNSSLANFILEGEYTTNDFIKTYFANVHSTKFIWVEWDENTEMVTEYQMNKREFGAFVQKFGRPAYSSDTHALKVRFLPSSKKMVRWLEERVA